MKKMNKRVEERNRRVITNLNGLRGLAVIFIFLYHLNSSVYSGGFIAVDIFLILSGFLTVYNFNLEYEKTGTISKKNYYKKRIRRIFPNLIFMLFTVYAVYSVIAPYQLIEMKDHIISSICGLVNYNYIFSNIDYFATSTVINPFGQLWSLAIEMQFYVIAPFLYVYLLKQSSVDGEINFKTSRKVGRLLLFYLIGVAIMPICYFFSNGNTSIVYYGTFNRVSALLIGMLIAWNFEKSKMDKEYRESKTFHDIFTGLITIALFVACFVIFGTETFLYHYGFFVIDLILAYYIWAITCDKNILTPIYSSRLFIYLGSRSYGIFLWHLPLIAIFQYQSTLANSILIVVSTLVMAEMSYQFLDCGIFSLRKRKNQAVFKTIGLALVFMVIFEVAIFVKKPENYATFNQEQYVEVAKNLDYLANEIDQFNDDYSNPQANLMTLKNNFEKYSNFIPSLASKTNIVVGDSLVRQLVQSLNIDEEKEDNTYFDYKIGMQADEVLDKLQTYAYLDSEDTNLLFNVGNNGPINMAGLNEMVMLYPQSDIYILDLISKQEWTNSSSKAINKIAKKYENVHVVPVRTLLDTNRNLLLPDDLHYTDETIVDVKLMILDTLMENSN